MNRARRWPPGDTTSGERRGAFTGARPDEPGIPHLITAVGDLSGLLKALAPRVLGSATYILNAQGQAWETYQVPYASIAIASYSAQKLILAASPLQGSAPGAGPGITVIPATGFRLVNLAGYTWSLYGGTQGDLVCVEAFTRPQPPAAGKLA